MNSFKPTLIRATIITARRMTSSTVAKASTVKDHSFRAIWLSDTATYPLIAIMGVAGVFLMGMAMNGLTTYKDVRLDKKKRGTMMRDWGDEEHKGVVQTLVQRRYEKIKSDRADRRAPSPTAHTE